MTEAKPTRERKLPPLKKLWPLAVLLLGLVLFFVFDLDDYVNFETLRDNRTWLRQQVDMHLVLTVLIYGLAYAVATAFSLPLATFFTVTSGFLFGQWLGTGVVVVFATTGATALFLIAKSVLGDHLRTRAGPWMQKLETGFRENELSYLLTLRLIPLFPFFVVNLVPAFLGVRIATYVGATAVGIIPGSFVYATIGAGLGSIFDAGETFSAKNLLTPEIYTALIGLAVLSLLPAAYKKIKARQSR